MHNFYYFSELELLVNIYLGEVNLPLGVQAVIDGLGIRREERELRQKLEEKTAMVSFLRALTTKRHFANVMCMLIRSGRG